MMRYRRLDENGDMTFGQSQGNFFINQPEAVAQLVMTRLRLDLGAWFYDMSDGTAWKTAVLGERTQQTRDIIVIDRVRNTEGMEQIDSYGSRMDPDERTWDAAMQITTVFGPIAVVTQKLPGSVPPLPQAVSPVRLSPATELGVMGGTPQTMVPANLLIGPESNVTKYAITNMSAGSW
jgi:hypothetical protein